MRNTLLRTLATAAVLGSAACAMGTAEPASQPVRASGSASAMTDADIAAIVVAANTIDADMGKLALSKSSHPEVRKFAQQMVTDHNAVNQAAVALVTRLGVTPTENATSRGLQSGAAEARARIAALDGAAFDRAYIDNEVAYHRAVLNAIDQALIPSAQNAELRATLVQVRPAIAAHLEHAMQVQASMQAGQ
jgi:putative membrane protein